METHQPERSSLERAIFAKCTHPERMAEHWERVIRSATLALPGGGERMDALLLRYLAPLPDPERALLHLGRFLDSSLSASGIVRDFLNTPRYLEQFLTIVSTSTFLAGVLERDAPVFRFLLTSGVLYERRTKAGYLQTAKEACASFPGYEARLNALRRYQRRELLSIAAGDIFGIRDLQSVVTALSCLADAIVELVLEYVLEEAQVSNGTDDGNRYCIIALGKLGGLELNYSSDIDIMILYEGREGGEAEGAARKVVEMLVRALTSVTPEGFLYRTDLRLRPDGSAGAPAHSVHAALRYYQERGALWERQMLLKARHAAGDTQVSAAFFEALSSFLFPATPTESPRTILRDVRKRLEQRAIQPGNVKHGPGGIRYIEFSVQAMQVIHAPRMPELRSGTTLEACAALERARLLTSEEAEALRDAYIFFRRIEHALQLERFEQVHALPHREDALEALAWKMHFSTREAFYQRLDAMRKGVLRTFHNIFEPALMERGNISIVRAEQYSLAAMGMSDVASAQKTLHQIIEGRNGKEHSPELRRVIEDGIGTLLSRISREPNPGLCLQSLEYSLHTTTAPEQLFPFLIESQNGRVLLRLCSIAPGVVRTMAVLPDALEQVFGKRERGAEEPLQKTRFVEQVRALGVYAAGEMDFQDYAEQESRIADECVQAIYEQALAPLGEPVIVVAQGKYGGMELNYGSDLDIFLVHAGTGNISQERVIEAAMEFERELRLQTGYVIDTRVRPEGSKGLPSIALKAYGEYFGQRAALWERQALLKRRVICGDASLAAEFIRVTQIVISEIDITSAMLDEILAMRRKSEPPLRRGSTQQFNVKRSPGGMMDAEYAVQAALLIAGKERMLVKGANTFQGLEYLQDALPEMRFHFIRLERHYHLLRKTQLAMRLLFERTSNTLPSSGSYNRQIVSSLGYGDEEEWRKELRAGQKETREDMLAVFERLRGIIA